MVKSTLFTVAFYMSIQLLLAQQITFKAHQKYTYTDGAGYRANDILLLNGDLIISGNFSDNGSHPIATRFNSKGEFGRDLYWDKVIGNLTNINVVNDTCILLSGGFDGKNLTTLSNNALYQRHPSFYKDFGDYATTLQHSFYNSSGQMVNIYGGAYTSSVKVQVLKDNQEISMVALDKPMYLYKSAVSASRKTLYIITKRYDDLINIFKYDISNPLKPKFVLNSYEYDNNELKYRDLLSQVTDDGFCTVSNVYETSEKDAEEVTYTTERKVNFYDENLKQKSTYTASADSRDIDYLVDYGNGQFLQVFYNYRCVDVYILDNKLEVVTRFQYYIQEDLEKLLCDKWEKIVVKLMGNTLGVLYPYAAPGDSESAINTWELFTFTLQ
jgi:hypothetical protein